MAPRVIDTCVVNIKEVSIGEDSGWRPENASRVANLCARFKGGEYGMGVLAIPSIRLNQESRPMLGVVDGCYRLSNGKATLAALKILLEEWENEGSKEACPSWATGRLLEAFQEGIRVDRIKFSSDEDDLNIAWWALMHDEELLNLKKTSLKDKIRVYNIQLSKACNDKAQAVKNLLAIFGTKKQATIYRWQSAATSLHEEVVDYWEEKTETLDLPQGYLLDNKYMVGTGGDARLKLKIWYAKTALRLLFAKFEDEQSCSVKEFIAEYCTAMKVVEQWEAKVKKDFGKVAETSLALQRVLRMLCTERGRVKVMEAVRARVPLHGVSGSDEHGVEECRNIIAELGKLKAGATAPGDGSSGAVGAGGTGGLGEDSQLVEGAVRPEGEASGDGSASMCADGMQDVSLLIGIETVSRFDLVLDVARGMVTTEMAHISMHSSLQALQADITSRIWSGQRTLYFIDAPTSRIRVVAEIIKQCSTLLQAPGTHAEKWSLLITCGHRLDLLSTVVANVSKTFPKRPFFVIQCAVGKLQTQKKLPSYLVCVQGPGCEGDQVVSIVDMSSCRASAYEGLRFRCTDPACKYRSGGLAADDGSTEEVPEVPEEDAEEPDVSAYLIAEEDETNVDQDMEVDAALAAEDAGRQPDSDAGSPRAHNKGKDVFTFAFPLQWYKRILEQARGSAQHIVIMTRTSHPALAMAARMLKMEVTCLVQGPLPHSMGHGQAFLESICLKQKWDEAKKSAKAQGVKRIRASALQFIEATAPPVAEQMIRVTEVSMEGDKKNWRGGINNQVENLQDKVTSLVSKELDSNHLGLMATSDGRNLITLRPLREGDTICLVSALWYDSLAMVEDMLSSGGNACLRDRLIRIDGVVMDASGDKAQSLYGIMVGACRHVMHFGGRRKAGPNAVIVVDTKEGFSDGLARLVVKTRNQTGIASKGAIYINYGTSYIHDEDGDGREEGAEAKKFKGALDLWLKKREEHDAEMISGEATPADAKAKETGEQGQADDEKKAGEKGKEWQAGDDPKVPVEGAAGKAGRSQGGEASEEKKPWDGQGIEIAIGEEDSQWGACVFEAPNGSAKGCVRLYAAPRSSGNKKVPPNSVLLVIREGKLVKAGNVGLSYQFTDPKKDQVFVVTNTKQRRVSGPKVLAKWIQELSLKSIQSHGSVTPTVPKVLKSQGTMSFVPAQKEVADFMQFCMGLGNVNVSWVMKNAEGVFVPWGIVVYTTKMVIVPATSSIDLQ